MLSFWQKDLISRPADVVIAGAGFVGLWCAYELKYRYPYLKVTVLEKENFPGGASVRNAGFACFGSPGEMIADAASMGEDAMWKIVALRYKGIEKLRTVLGDEAIGYDDCGGFECFADDESFYLVAEKLDWLNTGIERLTGVEAVFTVVDNRLPSLGLQNFKHLIFNPLEGSLHSGKTIRALLQKVTSMGVDVLFGTAVEKWETQTDHSLQIFAKSTEKFVIKVNRLLIATNAFGKQLASDISVQPARGQIALTAPIKGLKLRGTFHFDEGYYYWRNIGDRILLGGARNSDFTGENTFDISTSNIIQQALEAFLSKYIAVKKIEIEQRWAGIMGFTSDKKPEIIHPAENVWAVVACNGMGVALAPSIANEVVQKMFFQNVNAC